MTRHSLLFASIFALVTCAASSALAQQEVIIVMPVEAPPAAPPEPPAPPIAPEPELAEERAFSPGLFSIGLSGLLGLREAPRGDIAPTWTAGLDVRFQLTPWISLAARRVGYSHAGTLLGDRHAIGGSPALELALPFWERVQPFVQVGAGVQVRFGGEQGRTVGVAPFVSGGVRFFVAEIFSIAVESALHVPVSEGGFLFGHEVLPQGAVVLQSGLAFAFHIQ